MDEDMLMKIVRGTCNDARFLFEKVFLSKETVSLVLTHRSNPQAIEKPGGDPC